MSGDYGAVFVDTIGDLAEGDQGEGGGLRAAGGTNGMNGAHSRNQLTGVQSSLLALRQENLELKSAVSGLKIIIDRSVGIMNGNL